MTGGDQPTTLRKLGRYEVLQELGRGAMGIVYKAHDPRIDRVVVLKTLRAELIPPADLAEYRERFHREAKAAGILSHPGIVGVFDVGEDEETGESFLAMEYVAGTSLQTLVASGIALPPAQVAELVADVADALDFAHKSNVIHRDIKPANLLLGEGNRVKIADFGVARVGQSTLTAEGQALGTPNYMSPEQLTGEPLDGRTDLWSLGVVAYQLLTLQSPFSGRDFNTTVARILDAMPPDPHVGRPQIAEPLSRAVMKALAKSRDGRYATGRDMALAFRAAAASRPEGGVRPAGRTGEMRSIPAAPPPPASELDATRDASVRAPIVSGAAAAAAPATVARPTEIAAAPAAALPPDTVRRPVAPSSRQRVAVLAGAAVMALLAVGVALAIIAAILVTTEEGPPPPSLALLLAEKRYAEVEVLARQRLEADPGDTEAGVYLELARSGLARAEGGAAGGGLAAPVPAPPCDLSLDVTSSFSGHAVVTVDGVPVIDEVFSVKSTRFFGRTVPGTWRPARATAEAEVESGRRRVIVRVTSKSGKVTVEEARDLTLPEEGRVELTAVASTDRLDLRVD